MNKIVKTCKIHGDLTSDQALSRKPPRNSAECKKCNNIRSARHRYKKDIEHLIERKCSRCRQIKPKIDFAAFDWKLTSPYCSTCRKDNSTKDYLKNRSHLKNRFGITVDDYNLMLKNQNHCCAICKKPESIIGTKLNKSPIRLAVDHCHLTKRIRGVLCQRCNAAIGLFFDNKEFLNNAIEYLSQID